MSLLTLRDLTDQQSRKLAGDWFDCFMAEFKDQSDLAYGARDALESHLIEAIDNDPDAEPSRVRQALGELGDPYELALEWKEEAISPPLSFLKRGQAWFLKAVQTAGMVFAALLIVGGVIRILDPGAVGVFTLSDGTLLIGTPADRLVQTDHLDIWTAPVFILVGLACFSISSTAIRTNVIRRFRH